MRPVITVGAEVSASWFTESARGAALAVHELLVDRTLATFSPEFTVGKTIRADVIAYATRELSLIHI